MNFLKKLFGKKETIPLWWMLPVMIFLFLGIIDSSYLAVNQISGHEVVCNIYEVNTCENVLNSEYATLFGMHLSVWGFGYYITMFVLFLLYCASLDRNFFNKFFGISMFGFLFSVYLVYLQFFIIQNLCFYCLMSALFSTLIFITNSIHFIFDVKKNKSIL